MTSPCRAAVLALVLALAFFGPAASAAEAPRSAWWNRANVGLLPSFGSPDVDEDHLLVEGVAGGEEGWGAVAGLAFDLDGPVDDATLTLVATDVLPASEPPVACPLTEGFSPVAGGPWSDVPGHACDRAVVAEPTPDGARFLFRGLAALVAGGELRLLIAPGGPGRFVFGAPGAGALDVSATSRPSPGAVDVPVPDQGGGFEEPAPPFAVAPVPDGAALAPVSPRAARAPSSGPSSSFTPAGRFEPPASDHSTRLATAAVLVVALGAFTAVQRGGTTRLRPAQVGWRQPRATATGAVSRSPARAGRRRARR